MFTFTKNLKLIIMKTIEYFTKKTTALREELKQEIENLAKLYHSDIISIDDDSNMINFMHNGTGIDEQTKLSEIEIGKDFVAFYPCDTEFLPMDLIDVEDVHDLMLIHHVVYTQLKNEKIIG